MKRILIVITTLIILFCLIRGYYNLTDDFRIGNIESPLENRQEWNASTDNPPSNLESILNQNFTYLGKGAQVYAFVSADGKYVLKFFKFKHLRSSFFISLLPPIGPLKEYVEKNQARKKRKLEEVFQGHAIALEHDKKYSGLIYIHLNKTTNLNLKIHLQDKLGLSHTLDLDPLIFVLQKKGETLADVFKKIIKTNNLPLLITRGRQVLDMYKDEYQMGIFDRDHGVSHNIGFLGDEPFHLDIGKISYDPIPKTKEFYQKDLERVLDKMTEVVQEEAPKNAPAFHAALKQHLEEHF